MDNRYFGFAAATIAGALISVILPGSVAGQAQGAARQATVSRTADGRPDIQGFWATDAYTADIETGLPDSETAFIQGEAPPDPAKAMSLVVDPPGGKIPYQEWATARRLSIPTFRRGESSRGKPSTVRDIRPRTFCLHAPPRSIFTDFQLVQSQGSIVLAWEFNHTYRIIHMDGRSRIAPNVKLAMGDARGRWDNDTLIVETTNINDWDWFDYTGTFRSNAMRLVERFTVVDGATIQYQATIDDPNVFTRSWTFAALFKRTRTLDAGYELMEHACVEGERGVAAFLGDAARR